MTDLSEESFGDFPYLADQDDMGQAMAEQEQMYVESLRRVAHGTATMEDAKVLALGCGIDFRLVA